MKPPIRQVGTLSSRINDERTLLRSTASFLDAPIANLDDVEPGCVVLAGLFCEHFGGGLPGSRFAPRQLRYAGCPRTEGPASNVFDIGDLNVFPLQPLRNAEILAEQSEKIASSGVRLLAVGGDYSVTPHLIEGLMRAHPNRTIGLLRVSRRLDFHAPGASPNGSLTRSSATLRISQLLGAARAGVLHVGAASTITDEEKANAQSASIIAMHELVARTPTRLAECVGDMMTQCDACYLSVDVDVLSARYGETSSFRSGAGLSPAQLIAVLDQLADVPLIGADVMGHVPDLDLAGATATSIVSRVVNRIADLLADSSALRNDGA